MGTVNSLSPQKFYSAEKMIIWGREGGNAEGFRTRQAAVV